MRAAPRWYAGGVTDLRVPDTDRPADARADGAMRTFGLVVAIALALIALSFVVDFARAVF